MKQKINQSFKQMRERSVCVLIFVSCIVNYVRYPEFLAQYIHVHSYSFKNLYINPRPVVYKAFSNFLMDLNL